jgi:hypothetical protein
VSTKGSFGCHHMLKLKIYIFFVLVFLQAYTNANFNEINYHFNWNIKQWCTSSYVTFTCNLQFIITGPSEPHITYSSRIESGCTTHWWQPHFCHAWPKPMQSPTNHRYYFMYYPATCLSIASYHEIFRPELYIRSWSLSCVLHEPLIPSPAFNCCNFIFGEGSRIHILALKPAILPEHFRYFPQSLQVNAWVISRIMSRPFPSI